MAKTSVKGETVLQYLAKFPKLPDLSLARKLFKDHSILFKDVEDARYYVRLKTGKAGKLARKSASDKSTFKPMSTAGKPAYTLPDSHAETREPYIFPLANNRILVLSDFHVPYHNNAAIEAAVNFGLDKNINTILINGDLIDFHMLSRFEKDPRAKSVKEEFDTARAVLQYLRFTFPKAKIVWLKGNHCIRYEKWLFSKAPEIFDDSYFSMEERLRLNELKVEILDDKRLVKAGKLHITHGHLVVRGVFAPVNAARGCYLRAKVSTMIGHTHSVSEHSEKSMDDTIVTCWSTGCLCELRPSYDPLVNKHAHGFAYVEVAKDGTYSVKNMRILNGKIL